MAAENIFSQYIQPLKSADDWQAERDTRMLRREQLAGVQRQNALADLMAQQQRGEMARTERVRGDIRNVFSAGPDGVGDRLRGLGHQEAIDLADKLDKSALDRRKGMADAGKTETETQDAKRKALLQTVGALNSPDDALSLISSSVSQGTMSMQAAQVLGRLVQSDPKWQVKVMMMIGDPDKARDILLPHLQTNNTGGATVTQAVDKITGMPTVTGTIKNTQSPDNAASVGASYANAAATRAIAEATRDAAKITADQKSETDLRKEFADLPEVKNFKTAAPAYKAVVEAAKGNNPQADINLIYGLAKLYDPNSVVREGEYATIANSQSIPEWLKGHAQRLTGGGRLTEATKKQILEQAAIRYNSMEGDMAGAQGSYGDIAKRRGLKPENVFPKVGGGSRPDSPLTSEEQAELKKLREQLGRK